MSVVEGERRKIKKVETFAIQIKAPQRKEMGDNKERPEREAIPIKGPQRGEKCDNKMLGNNCYTDQGPAEGEEG